MLNRLVLDGVVNGLTPVSAASITDVGEDINEDIPGETTVDAHPTLDTPGYVHAMLDTPGYTHSMFDTPGSVAAGVASGLVMKDGVVATGPESPTGQTKTSWHGVPGT